MAITRRQFVTRLGALAAAAGMGQSDVSQLVDALAFSGAGTNLGGTLGKPRVIWIHGAECTGCSTSLLGIFENTGGIAVEGTSITTGYAAGLAGILPTQLSGSIDPDEAGNFTLHAAGYNVEGYDAAMNIADVVVDVVDIQYHETIMGMGADLAAQWLKDFKSYVPVAIDPDHPELAKPGDYPFVLVVEGALQDRLKGGAWDDLSDTSVPWCSIGMTADGEEHDMAETVVTLANKSTCAAIIPIGQCACYGGYPGCKPPISEAVAGFDPLQAQTGAMGVFDYLNSHSSTAGNKVINVPGCPTNPWWFTLTVVLFLVDLVNPARPLGVLTAAGAPAPGAIDGDRRLKMVYGTPIHGPYCPRYRDYVNGLFAAQPGEAGCLQKIGCKGPATNSLCGMHGWNNQQPQNVSTWDYGVSTVNLAPDNTTRTGGHCTCAGAPCMACTEKGYPDSFVPFVART